MLGEEKRRDEARRDEKRWKPETGNRKKERRKFLDWESYENWGGRVEVMLILTRKKKGSRNEPIERGKMM